MSNEDPFKPRLREITEGALGNIIGAIAVTILGVAGGITIGWIPTFIVLLVLSGGLIVWYRLDPSFQRLFHQRLFKLRHAISAESVILSRWNLIAEEVVSTIARQNNLDRKYLQTERQKTLSINGQEYLELVLDYKLRDAKWLVLANNNGVMVDTYGGFRSVAGECDNCNASILVRYGQGKNGQVVAEPQTTCRRCKKSMTRRVINLDHNADVDVKLQRINNVDTKFKGGKVCVYVEYTVRNYGSTAKVSPKVYLKTAKIKDGKHVQYIAQTKLKSFEIPSFSEITREFTWELSYETIVLTKEVDFIKIEFTPC